MKISFKSCLQKICNNRYVKSIVDELKYLIFVVFTVILANITLRFTYNITKSKMVKNSVWHKLSELGLSNILEISFKYSLISIAYIIIIV